MKHLLITRILIASLAFVIALQIALITGGHFQLGGDLAAAQAALAQREPRAGDWALLALIVPYLASLIGAWFGRKQARGWLTLSIMASLLFMNVNLAHPVEGLLNSLMSMLEGALLVALWCPPRSAAAEDHPRADTGSRASSTVMA